MTNTPSLTKSAGFFVHQRRVGEDRMHKGSKNILALILVTLLTLAGCAGPLVTAAQKGNDQEVKALLDSGANASIKEDGQTPLITAIWYRHSSTAKLLIERGADVNQPACVIDGYDTPLTVAAVRDNSEIINLLINKGADLEYALSVCHQKSNAFMVGYLYKRCQAILRPVQIKQEDAKAQDTFKNGPAKTAQPAVENAIRDQEKYAGPSSVPSDVSMPSFGTSDRIMTDDDLAVIVGIESYQNLPKSDYSLDDAKLVKQYAKALGFRERNIQLITDDKATKSSIEKSVEAWLKNRVKSGSRVLFYYSGHGAPDPANGEAYLVPYDGDPNYLSITGYPLRRLYDVLGGLQAAEVTVVLDSCFSGAGGRSVLAKGARPLVMTTTALPVTSNMVVLTATQGSQISTSSPDKGHGIFTYYFLKALKDGKKNVAEIYEYLKPKVEDDAKAINVQQSPSLNPAPEKLTGRFNLRK